MKIYALMEQICCLCVTFGRHDMVHGGPSDLVSFCSRKLLELSPAVQCDFAHTFCALSVGTAEDHVAKGLHPAFDRIQELGDIPSWISHAAVSAAVREARHFSMAPRVDFCFACRIEQWRNRSVRNAEAVPALFAAETLERPAGA